MFNVYAVLLHSSAIARIQIALNFEYSKSLHEFIMQHSQIFLFIVKKNKPRCEKIMFVSLSFFKRFLLTFHPQNLKNNQNLELIKREVILCEGLSGKDFTGSLNLSGRVFLIHLCRLFPTIVGVQTSLTVK